MKVRDPVDSERMNLYMICMPDLLTCGASPLPSISAHSCPSSIPRPSPYSSTPSFCLPSSASYNRASVKFCCSVELSCQHWFSGRFDVTQIFLLYHSTELRANSCCSVNGITCDLSVQHLFAMSLLLSQGNTGGREVEWGN